MDRDQTAKRDAGKIRPTLVPRQIIRAIAAVRGYGVEKYPTGGADNWKRVEPERFRDAAFRHFLSYLDDPKGVDSESGLPHLWHCCCNLAFLVEVEDTLDGHTRSRISGDRSDTQTTGEEDRIGIP